MSLSVLPKNAHGFSDPDYWRKFFSLNKEPFEWYGDFEQLADIFGKYIRPSDAILQVGCGSSELATQLYENGFRNVHSIDIEPAVINSQKSKNKGRPELTFEVGDATNLAVGDESYSVVVDKGTLDALLPPSADDGAKSDVAKMLNEVLRVLQAGGRYLLVTLAQDHIVDFWISHLRETKQFILRTHKVENKACGFQMPVFVLVATKMRIATDLNLLTNKMVVIWAMEAWRSGADRAERVSSAEELKFTIKEEQELAQFIHYCSNHLMAEASIDFQCPNLDLGYRYRLFLLDSADAVRAATFAAFIVPIGREGEWIFATEKGRIALLKQCNVDRLVIVFLNRNQEYKDLETIKQDLGYFITMLDSREVNSGVFQILSVGQVDVKKTVCTGTSRANGKWTVEEVVVSEKDYRRLVFLNTMNLVQSEALLRKGKKNKKVVQLDILTSEFHLMMVAGLSLHPTDPLVKPDVPLRMIVLGLGGGLLAAYLLRNFKKSLVHAVEFDCDVIKIATDYFSFPHSDPRMKVKCMDALEYLKQSAAGPKHEKYDAIFVDIADGNDEHGISCPTPQFLTPEALEDMKNALKPDGLLLMNLVTRDDEMSVKIKQSVSQYFPALNVIRSFEDVNEVLIGQANAKDEQRSVKEMAKDIRKDLPCHGDVLNSFQRMTPFVSVGPNE